MSHSTVLVIGEDVEALLAPYDENMQVEPYWEVEAESPLQFWATEMLLKEGHLTDPNPTWEQVLAAYEAKYPGASEDEKFRVSEDGRLERETTYNPKSRWDWYAVGGRWRGSLRLKPGARGHLESPHWTETFGGREPEPMDPLACDSARKADLDIEGMRQAAADAAAKAWDEYAAIIAEHGEVIPWSTILDKHGVANIDDARKEYRAQPAIKPLQDSGLIGFFSGVEEIFHNHTRESYIHMARKGAVPGFATLTEKGWIERGHMGWFGVHSGDRSDHWDYLDEANRLIDEAPDDALFTLVDVHI